jgi:hypothetical protein
MIGLTYTGWDGSVWDFRTGPVRLTTDGLEGLSNLTFNVYTQDTALRDGQFMTGWKAEARELILPLMFGRTGDALEWLALERRWMKLMHPAKPGTLTVTAPDGSARTLDMRFVDDGGASYERDPSKQRLTVYPMRFIADDPWFKGPSFGNVFVAPRPTSSFFGGDVGGKATPFVIGPSNRIDTATITNGGDIPAWPKYTLRGPISAFRIALGGGEIAGQFPINAGSTLTIETSPLRQIALMWTPGQAAPVNVTRQLKSFGFRPIPEGAAVRLDINVTGLGDFAVDGNPHYFRGW